MSKLKQLHMEGDVFFLIIRLEYGGQSIIPQVLSLTKSHLKPKMTKLLLKH